MKTPQTYQTLERYSEGEYKEKGSKFIGIAINCENEEEAKKHLEAWRNQHFQARHLCYAYRFGLNKDVFRANDDGEPNNSAGAPILGQIISYDLTNVLIGVVRYFGGVKLGVGGLINAYRTAAKEAIESGKMVTVEVKDYFGLYFNYVDMPFIMDIIKNNEVIIKEQNFFSDCYLKIAINISNSEEIIGKLSRFNSLKTEHFGTF